MLIMLLIMVGFIGLGIMFMNGKGAMIIAGYNTMSPVEKEKYDEVALCKFMGKMMFALSFSMVFGYLVIYTITIRCSTLVLFYLLRSLYLRLCI
ncbi:hypothetical protein CSV61_01530 [Sporosarcina sp. P3]|uniref:DUF3784 domain-containing protein n=1 Tax=Sporosarcina sp. P3 TaxID=2048245 RepID=UPI000C164BB1|nr:hypothetical protein CSV61_01530 [Sporosarcina sp. P3]